MTVRSWDSGLGTVFLSKFLRFGDNLLLVFEQTGDHKIPAKKLGFKLPEATKGR